jgi:hypothetical protein
MQAGLTPLMLAAMKNDTRLMQALIHANADPEAKDPSGKTAFTLANIAEREKARREAEDLEATRKAASARAALEAAREEAARKATHGGGPRPDEVRSAANGLADLALVIIKIGTGGGGH